MNHLQNPQKQFDDNEETAPLINHENYISGGDEPTTTIAKDLASAVIANASWPLGAACVAIGLAFPVASLLIFHWRLAAIAQTTNESVRGVYRNTPNRHNHGCRRNCTAAALALCHKTPPSRLTPFFDQYTRALNTDALSSSQNGYRSLLSLVDGKFRRRWRSQEGRLPNLRRNDSCVYGACPTSQPQQDEDNHQKDKTAS
eukprot:CAMPEP_0197330650 /NCGR_PEP_ID=MMETSP0892-20130614/6963_1 /TAXON_ID=44058 ORGANISM="Aureoumbra lagunensis, Strain CCMP1510" /NCGR_SAMPLE_ID=MMETSP0892 /ASSEMBLY_ACC=CAM_ASM_000538 /LENGTH=200 /DNA_ID=CAMNT_0042827931 /DNA_START=667 /DNA_END=1269 /DNA_ORIENTATION=+